MSRQHILTLFEQARERDIRAAEQMVLARFGQRFRHRRRRGPEDGCAVPIEPDRPQGLSGGAAAALDFGDE